MMSVVVILVLLETVRFLIKDKSETLSSKYVCRTKPTPQNYKIFCSGQHSRGVLSCKFPKTARYKYDCGKKSIFVH